MRPAASIKAWLNTEQMFQWLREAPDQSSYQRRLAIWLTHTGRLHAHKVAAILGVSTQAVWLWIRQFNAQGPGGLDRAGRGGRRWALLSLDDETLIIDRAIAQTSTPGQPLVLRLRRLIERQLARKVSPSYVYRLLARHDLSTKALRPDASADLGDSQDDFRKHSQPWRRQS